MAWRQQQNWQARPAGATSWQPQNTKWGQQSNVAPAVPATVPVPTKESFVVSTSGKDSEEVVVRTLVGEYTESGSNHGRKVFKKVADGRAEAVDVYMYYWDSRDGPSFEGWWFGNKLGGTQVWSHNASGSLTPPPSGWKIPWDGSVRATLSVTNKAEQQKNEAQMKLKNMTTDVNSVSTAAKGALDQAKAAAADYTSSEGLKDAETLLQPQLSSLAEAMKQLTDAQRAGSNQETLRQVQQMRSGLQALMSAINVELGKVRSSKQKAEQSEKQKALEERDMTVFQEILPEAVSKANAAEDAVEKAVITSEMIAAGGDDLDEVRQAVGATEQAVQEAQKAMGEARIFLNAKQAAARRYESEKVKAKAIQELGQLQQQLQEAQQKLVPLKNVRQEFVQRTAAQKMMQEVLEKLSPAEVDVDRAEEATQMLTSEEGASKELMVQAQQAVAKAGEHVNTVVRFIESKKKNAVGLAKEELQKMEDRARQSVQRLVDLKTSQKEATEKVGLEVLVKEAAEKLQTVQETVAKAADAEGPFLMGVEELPLDETLAAVKAVETASTAANTAASIARMFIATKLVEAKRFTPELSKEAQTKLKAFQSDLETHTKRLNELKKSTAERKKAVTMREAEHEVKKAEELGKAVAEAAKSLMDDEKLTQLSSEEIRAASEGTIKAEQAASTHLTETRKYITARQIEAKGREASSELSSELIKYEARLRVVATEIGKYKKVSASVDSRLKAKKSVEDCHAKVKAVEQKFEKLTELADAIDNPKEDGEVKDGEAKDGEAKDGEAKDGEAKDGEAKDGETKAVPSKKLTGKEKVREALKEAEAAAAEMQAAIKSAMRFIDMQMKVTPTAAKDVEKLKPRLEELQESLDRTVASMRERSEKVIVDGIVKDSATRVNDVEQAIKKMQEAEEPFKTDIEAEKVSECLSNLESATQSATQAVSGAKTFVGVKKLACKRLAEGSKKAAEEQLSGIVTKLDELAKTLAASKKDMNQRKQDLVKKEVEGKVLEAEKKVQASEEATTALAKFGEKPPEGEEAEVQDTVPTDVMKPDEMKSACEKADLAQKEARNVVTAAQKLLLSRQKDAKNGSGNPIVLEEINRQLAKLGDLVASLDKNRTAIKEQEHKFVAQRLLKDGADQITKLEKLLEASSERAAMLTSEEDGGMTSVVFLSHAVEGLKSLMKRSSKTPKELFTDLSGGKELLEEASFTAKLKSLEETAPNDLTLSEQQIQQAFKRWSGGKEGVSESMFLDEFRTRYFCTAPVTMTDGLVIKGGKTVRKVDINEILEGLEEQTKEENLGLMRVKVRAEKDEKEGYVTVAGNQGTVFLENYTAYAAFQKGLEQDLKNLQDQIKEVVKYLDDKVEELRKVREGPLFQTKGELSKLKPRVVKVQQAYAELKKKVTQAEMKLSAALEDEKKRRLEAADRKAAADLVEDVVALAATDEEKLSKVFPAAEQVLANLGDKENPLDAIETCQKDLSASQESLSVTTGKIREKMEGIKGQTGKGPLSEARNSLVKLKVKVGALENKCKKLLQGLKAARAEMSVQAEEALLNTLRLHARKEGLNADDLFKQLSKGEAEIKQDNLKEFLQRIPELQLQAPQLDLALDRFSAGLTKLAVLELAQEFQKCVKEVALTTALEVKDGKTVRKLLKGEVLEVLEVGRLDTATGLSRLRCRAIIDQKEGWVTSQGNAGSSFLSNCRKPYMCCEEESPFGASFESTSEKLKDLQPGEVLEMLEGPRKEELPELLRMRGKASKDGKSGWVTFKEASGEEYFRLAKLLVCKQSIALTTSFDIATGKALRKLDVGEALDILEGPNEDSARSLSRVKVLAKKDGKEGWVTVKGNQGTSYTEESDKHYVCTRSVSLESKFASGSTEVRRIEEEEVFEALEAPKAEKKDGIERCRGRTLTDGKEGWFTLSAKSFAAWTPTYKCVASTVLNDGPDIKESKALRKLEPGEVLEALDTPIFEKSAGLLRLQLRTQKDNLLGFATVRGSQGTALLQPLVDEVEKKPAAKSAVKQPDKNST